MKRLAGACLALAMAAPAQAEWQGFDWGMTEAQVEAATSDVSVHRLETINHRTTYPSYSSLGGVWTQDGHDYRLHFYFDADGRLRDIDVAPEQVECAQQNGVFAERFGAYEEEASQLGAARRSVRRWRLATDAELMTTVLHFPSNDRWICSAIIKQPVAP